jgi:hypothetical protein
MSFPRTTIVPDVHGDVVAFRTSLMQASVATFSGDQLQAVEPDHALILSGDLVDRAPWNEEVLDLVDALRQKYLPVTWLAGNHDLFCLEALETAQTLPVTTWMVNGGGAWLQTAALRGGLLWPSTTSAQPENEPVSGVERACLFFLRLWDDILRRQGLERVDTAAAFAAVQQRYQAQYKALFATMTLLEQPRPGVCVVHAGFDEASLAAGLSDLQTGFRAALQALTFSDFNAQGRFYEPTWRRADRQPGGTLLSQVTSTALQAEDVHLVIRGHEIQKDGRQHLTLDHDTWVLHADAGMSSGYADIPCRWAYTQIEPDGRLYVGASATGRRYAGRVKRDGTFSPSVGMRP